MAVSTSRGSRLNTQANLADNGDLRIFGFGTKDLRPGFRYHIIVIKREGVKTVNGKEPPKE
jgi:ribosomal protein S12